MNIVAAPAGGKETPPAPLYCPVVTYTIMALTFAARPSIKYFGDFWFPENGKFVANTEF